MTHASVMAIQIKSTDFQKKKLFDSIRCYSIPGLLGANSLSDQNTIALGSKCTDQGQDVKAFEKDLMRLWLP